MAALCKASWDIAFRKIEREKLLAEYRRAPIGCAFFMVWGGFFLMFFVGTLIPAFGEINITSDGWQVWEVGFFGTFGLWLVTWFVDIETMDKK